MPGSTDDVYSNTFTVAIDQDITVNTLRNSSGTGITAGGGFTLANPSSRVVNIAVASSNQGGGSGSSLIAVSGSGSCTINGSITGGALNARYGLNHSGSATLTINGNVTGGTNAGAYGVFVSGASAIVNVNGVVQGGTGPGVYQSGASARLTVVGSVSGGTGTSGPGLILAAGAGRFDAELVYSAFAAPIQNAVAVQFVRGGTSLGVTAPSADNWPAATGATITLVEGGGGVDPLRYLNVAGTAVPIQ